MEYHTWYRTYLEAATDETLGCVQRGLWVGDRLPLRHEPDQSRSVRLRGWDLIGSMQQRQIDAQAEEMWEESKGVADKNNESGEVQAKHVVIAKKEIEKAPSTTPRRPRDCERQPFGELNGIA